MSRRVDVAEITELPFGNMVEASAESFDPALFFDLVGRAGYMTTVCFRAGSPERAKFGNQITGVAIYSASQLEQITTNSDYSVLSSRQRFACYMRDISFRAKDELKYQGFDIQSIERLFFNREKRPAEQHDDGKKKIPNVIEIELDDLNVDVDLLEQSYLFSKLNNQVNLPLFEKERLIGITLAINDRIIDKRILAHLGFSETDLGDKNALWEAYYQVKRRRKTISDEEEATASELDSLLRIQALNCTLQALPPVLQACAPDPEFKDAFSRIAEEAIRFRPQILLHGKTQIFWDLDSYLHIVLRHVEDFQVGAFLEKSPIPYRAQDLKALIEKVLSSIDDEIEHHFRENGPSVFRRSGKMAAEFNGDYYHLRIDDDGRLVQFHPAGKRYS